MKIKYADLHEVNYFAQETLFTGATSIYKKEEWYTPSTPEQDEIMMKKTKMEYVGLKGCNSEGIGKLIVSDMQRATDKKK